MLLKELDLLHTVIVVAARVSTTSPPETEWGGFERLLEVPHERGKDGKKKNQQKIREQTSHKIW